MTTMAEVYKYLDHQGIKGMKWGVRRDPKTGVRPIANTLDKSGFGRAAKANVDRHDQKVAAKAEKKLAKADKRWEKNINTVPTFIVVHNRAADLANNLDIERINNLPKYRNRSMHDPNDPVTKAYIKDHETAFNKRIQQASDEIIGPNPSGTKRIHIDLVTGEGSFVDIQHAVKEDAGRIVLELDELRQVISYMVVPNTLIQSGEEIASEILEHHGVKGMKWGVRRKSSSRPGGGKTTYKKAPARLSETELNRRIKRMELEKKYADLNATPKHAGKQYAQSLLENSGRTAVAGVVGTTIAFLVKRSLQKRFSD